MRKLSRRRPRSVDDAELGHFTLFFAEDRGRQRNVQRFITHVHSYCFAHQTFCFNDVLVAGRRCGGLLKLPIETKMFLGSYSFSSPFPNPNPYQSVLDTELWSDLVSFSPNRWWLRLSSRYCQHFCRAVQVNCLFQSLSSLITMQG